VTRGGTGLRVSGAYEVLSTYRNNDVTVVIEQNESNGILHAPVAVIDGPGGRVACDPDDTDLLAAEAARAAGDESLHEQRELEFALRSVGFEPEGGKRGGWVRNGARIVLGMLVLALPTRLLGLLLPLLVIARPAMPLVDAYKKKVIDAVYGNTAVAPPATIYTGLSTSTPTQAGGSITEPSGNGYARVGLTNNTTNYGGATTANPSVKDNDAAITFPAATGSWGTVTHWTTHDAATVGNPIDWAALTASQAISSGTTASFAVGQWISQVQGA